MHKKSEAYEKQKQQQLLSFNGTDRDWQKSVLNLNQSRAGPEV